MKILALDSSTYTASAAVLDGDAVLAECSCGLRATHSEQLLNLVRDALARAGVTLADIERIAAGVGPGSFTGVRIGLASAKGLSVAAGIPLVGVSSLDALGESAWGVRDATVLAALDARRGELYACAWSDVDGVRTRVVAPANLRPEALGERLAETAPGARVWAVGDATQADLDAVAQRSGLSISRAPGVCAAPLARWIGRVARMGGGALDEGELEPTYLRGSDAKLPGSAR